MLLTNPPYSGDHVEKLVSFLAECNKPWMMLVPTYVAKKSYFRCLAELKPSPLFLCPTTRYFYYHPRWIQDDLKHRHTAPFKSIWICWINDRTNDVIKALESCQRQSSGRGNLRIARSLQAVPADMWEEDGIIVRKRPNPRQRRKLAKRKHGFCRNDCK